MQSENGPSVAVCSKTVDFQQSINQHRKTSPACCCHTLDIKLLHLGRAMQRRPESCTCRRWWFTVTENGKIAVCSTCISKLRRGGRKCMSFNTTNLSCHLKSCHRNKNVSCWLSCQGQPWEAGNYHISYRASLFFFFGTDTGTNSMTLISQWNTKRKQVNKWHITNFKFLVFHVMVTKDILYILSPQSEKPTLSAALSLCISPIYLLMFRIPWMYMAHQGQYQHEVEPVAVVITPSVQVLKSSRHENKFCSTWWFSC